MTKPHKQKLWLPYLVGSICGGISIAVSLVLWLDIQAYFELLRGLQDYLPWLALLFGLGFSIMLTLILRVAQLAKKRALRLVRMNADLKKEINERTNAEESKQKLEIALLQGQKLQAMGTLAGGIAHDFNNILYAIIGYTEMAREDVPKDSQLHRNLGKVIEASHRGQELVSRILSFSRRQHHEFTPLNLATTIEAALSLLRPTIPASVSIDFNHDIDVMVLANQTQIHQVFVNIINNAVDAMDGEGTVTISMSMVAANDPILRRIPDIQAVDYCKIEISDTGHGMDQQTTERIFEPFYTTKEVGKGTGLGLSIVHSIVKEHKGDVTVSSQLGQGTKFMILLPVCIE